MPRISRHRLAVRGVRAVRIIRAFRGFTLTELMAVIAIITVIIGLLISAVSKVRHVAAVTKDLAQVRNLQLAHQAYMADNEYRFVDMNLAHASFTSNPSVVPWIESLQKYYGVPLAVKSPLDDSPHWPLDQGGEGAPLQVVQADGYEFRRTSYGCNAFLSWSLPSPDYAISGDMSFVYDRMTKIKNPSSTVDFLLMAETGGYAGSDHVHPEGWSESDAGPENAAALAAEQMSIAAVGGRDKSADARSNYGFLDGHSETLRFADIYVDPQHNKFDPAKVHALLNLQAQSP